MGLNPYGTRPRTGGGNTTYYSKTITGADGGGKHQMNITNNLTINGEINSNGREGRSSVPRTGGGSGGSVNIFTAYLLGSGNIYSNGGEAHESAGAGAGGRIKIVGDQTGFTGLIQANGGINGDYASKNGEDGTVQ